jgi:preprotein translocase subunit YajC
MGGAAIIIWIVVFFGIFYFLAVRPQRRQRQAHQEMVAMLKKGDEIVTVGGMFGVIRRMGDDWIELEITKGTRVRFLKRAISQIVSEEEDEDEDYEEYVDEIETAADEDEVVDEDVADEVVLEEDVADDAAVADVADEAGEVLDEYEAPADEEKPA